MIKIPSSNFNPIISTWIEEEYHPEERWYGINDEETRLFCWSGLTLDWTKIYKILKGITYFMFKGQWKSRGKFHEFWEMEN